MDVNIVKVADFIDIVDKQVDNQVLIVVLDSYSFMVKEVFTVISCCIVFVNFVRILEKNMDNEHIAENFDYVNLYNLVVGMVVVLEKIDCIVVF